MRHKMLKAEAMSRLNLNPKQEVKNSVSMRLLLNYFAIKKMYA